MLFFGALVINAGMPLDVLAVIPKAFATPGWHTSPLMLFESERSSGCPVTVFQDHVHGS